ncbi:MAG: homoserine kinase [Chloroflexi bacterium]|nr:homoserine kinase [Chloroflexota bacterium]
MSQVEVHVPATTANLGPGFDCLGMALDIWNTFSFEPADVPSVSINGEGAAGRLRADRSNLVCRSAERYFQEIGRPAPPLAVGCWNRVPLARGMGSSSSAIVGGLLGAGAIAGNGRQPDMELVWKLAVEIEGHPDNVTPALFGGCQIVVRDSGKLVRASVPIPPDMRAVLFIPDAPMPTAQARGVLPPQVSREDAVYNIGRVALLVNALATGKLEDIKVATQDRLHQPVRQQLMPAMRLLFRAALDGGALGVFLSGAGSSVLALTRGRELTVAYEMRDMAEKAQLPGDVKITVPSLKGAYIAVGE